MLDYVGVTKMNEKNTKRYESMNKMLRICEKPITIREIIGYGVPRSTVYRNIRKLMEQGRLEKIQGWGENGYPIDKYQSTLHKDVVPSDYLKLIMENYMSGVPEKKESAIFDMKRLADSFIHRSPVFIEKKILDEDS